MEYTKLEFNPAPDKVLIKKDEIGDKTAAGLILGKNDKGRVITATIMSGPDAGSRIVFKPGISSVFIHGEDKLHIIFKEDIIARV